VRMFSRKLGRRIEQGTGQRTNEQQAKTRKIVNPKLRPGQQHFIQHGGEEGFTVEYWRKVYRGATLIADERFRASYRPEDTIIEVGPPAPPPPPATTATTPGTQQTGTGGTTTGLGTTDLGLPGTTTTP